MTVSLSYGWDPSSCEVRAIVADAMERLDPYLDPDRLGDMGDQVRRFQFLIGRLQD